MDSFCCTKVFFLWEAREHEDANNRIFYHVRNKELEGRSFSLVQRSVTVSFLFALNGN